MKILITGGAGYWLEIGSCSIKKITRSQLLIIIFLIKKFKSLNNENLKLIEDDVRNFERHKEIIKKQDFIIPLATLVGAPLCDKFQKIQKK